MPPATVTALVHATRHEAQDTISIELHPLQGSCFPSFDAGAHIDVHLPNGLVRSYSLVNSPDEQHRYVLGVLRANDSLGGSAYIHSHLGVGTRLTISAPRNHFRLDESGPRFVLIAGGIGITPIFCMARRLASLGKPVELLYRSRSRAHAAWLADIEALGIHVSTHFDADRGAPPDLNADLAKHDAQTRFYCCGPSPMLAAFEDACARLGFPHAHIERFLASAPDATASKQQGYEVKLAKSGKTLHVEAGTRLLDALLDAGVDVAYSCQQGICGTCETGVIEGEVDHRDSVLSQAERDANRTMMVCVSGSKGKRLVLDC